MSRGPCTEGLIFAGGHGIITKETIVFAVSALPILLIGVSLGQRMFNVASPEFFKKVALILLFALSLTGIVRAIATLL